MCAASAQPRIRPEFSSRTQHKQAGHSAVLRYVMFEVQTASKRGWSKRRSTKSGAKRLSFPDTVVTGVNERGLMPSKPNTRIRAATVYSATSTPSACRSAVIRGEP